MSVKIKKVEPSRWSGNGFGRTAAVYDVVVQDESVGHIWAGAMGWRVSITTRQGKDRRMSPTDITRFREVRQWAIEHGVTLYHAAMAER